MKYLKAIIQRLNGLKGGISEKALGLEARIHAAETKPKVEITLTKLYVGKWHKRIGYRAAFRLLDVIYRFLSAPAKILTGRKAKATAAPAVTIDIDSEFRSDTDVQMATHPATEIAIDQKEKLGVLAAIAAYRRAAAVYVSKIVFRVSAGAIAAPGAIAKSRKAMKLSGKYKMEAADGAIAESRFNRIRHKYSAGICHAPTIGAAAGRTITEETTATAIQAAAVDVEINNPLMAGRGAKMATWIDPYWDGDVLVIKQAYSATQADDGLVVT